MFIKGSLIWQKLKVYIYARSAATNHRNGTENVRPAANGTQWKKKSKKA